VQSRPEDRLALIRRYYEAYDRGDRSLMESVLHAQFTFSSPNGDDNIERAVYFARCWPNHEAITHFTLLDVCADRDHALIRYHASTVEGNGFGNVEHFAFEGDLISHVSCYFGPPLPEQDDNRIGVGDRSRLDGSDAQQGVARNCITCYEWIAHDPRVGPRRRGRPLLDVDPSLRALLGAVEAREQPTDRVGIEILGNELRLGSAKLEQTLKEGDHHGGEVLR
jgi:hypothetical protein